MSATEHRPYRFGPRDARGLVLGVRPGQAAIVSVVAIVAVGLLRASSSPSRFGLIAVDLGAGLAAAFVPVRGRTLGSWAPIASAFVATGLTGRRREVASRPFTPAPRRPSVFVPFSIETIDRSDGRAIGAICDRRHGTLSAALVVNGSPFVLLDDADRDREVAGWSSVLSALATSPYAPERVQWIERTVPDRRQALRDRVTALLAEPDPDTPADPDALRAAASYAALVEAESTGSYHHECVICVSVRSGSSRFAPLGSAGASDADDRLSSTLASLEEQLSGIGIDVVGALSPSGIGRYLDRSFRDTTAPLAGAWPIAAEAKWGAFRTDALFHSTYWIAEWPRSDVSSEFLLPLLRDGGFRRGRSQSSWSRSVRPGRRGAPSMRGPRSALTVRSVDGTALVRRRGVARQHDAVIRREEELASGHAGYRFSGYVSVSASDEAGLERSCAHVEQAAALARLELRRLFGSQDTAFCCTLPVGRGCG